MVETADAFLAFLFAAAVATLLVPLSERVARRVGAIDLPRERGLHDVPTPKLSGTAILNGIPVELAAVGAPAREPVGAGIDAAPATAPGR